MTAILRPKPGRILSCGAREPNRSGRQDDTAAYDAQVKKLADMFRDNFKKFLPFVDERVQRIADQIANVAG